ncbi:SPOR domain-containing protein [Methylovirgula sp. 4M-Z18]|uniref:SPOR domain-containing protein n=1 Tax=Methylovirgula sp. 4M-Z18 TaxID=2293567 RepID=UPI000E2F3145|nr:SPOR domain-containing protein [Methylovirgula sp. 4M-Z18]RFB81039.1 SPOR domain-containing protein [Methylovirgula sp. 4M-Z18]
MSEAFNRQRHEINLDAFERSLREEPVQAKPAEDPLAELARLVGRDDPFKAVFDTGTLSRQEPAMEGLFPASSSESETEYTPTPYALRGQAARSWTSYEEDQPQRQEPQMSARPVSDPWDDEAPEAAPVMPPRAAANSRKGLYALMGGAAIAVLAVGGLFAMKSGGVTSVGGVPFIKASDEPTKIQPQVAVASADGDGQNISILDHSSDHANVPTKVVNNEEQPIDLSHAAQPATPHPIPSEPKKVRTVSVRPDGSIIGAPPPVPAAPRTTAQVQPAAVPAATETSAPQAPAAPRQFMPIGPGVIAIPQQASATPAAAAPEVQPHPQNVQPAQSTATPKAAARPTPIVKLASAAATPTTGGPLDLAPKAKPAVQTRTAVASAETPEPATTGATGNYAVQLAAEGSEQDAKVKSARLAAQFGSALGGRHLSIRQAAAGGKTVYRVRVAGMSKEEAVSTCEKLKASGGACFIAKD